MLNDTQDHDIASPTRTPRKLARRYTHSNPTFLQTNNDTTSKSKRYSFNSKDAATAEDLYKVFYNHGIKAGNVHVHQHQPASF